MDQRQGDPRIYIVTLLFLSCIISGGVLLGLYLLLSDPNPLFLQAGMVFVGFPWLFWFFAYVYSCILKPCTVSVSKSVSNFDPEKGEEEINNKNVPAEIAPSPSDPVATPVRNSPRDGEKHVQFENVVMVLGDEDDDRNEGSSNNLIPNHVRMEDEEQENKENGRLNSRTVDEDCDRTPLRLSVGNK